MMYRCLLKEDLIYFENCVDFTFLFLCEAFNRRLAQGQLVSEKRKVSFGSVMTHIRTRLRFALLRSIVTALRGVRGRKSGSGRMKDLSNVNFDFVPEREMYDYESF